MFEKNHCCCKNSEKCAEMFYNACTFLDTVSVISKKIRGHQILQCYTSVFILKTVSDIILILNYDSRMNESKLHVGKKSEQSVYTTKQSKVAIHSNKEEQTL